MVRYFLYTGAINLFLRGAALAGKFIFILYISRYFSLDDFGMYGLLAAIVTIGIQIIGLDYYIYNSRRILSTQKDERRTRYILEQVKFHLRSYLLFIPLLFAAIVSGISGMEIAWAVPLLIIIVAEHLTQEASRLLVTLSRSPEANAIFFARTSMWMLVFMAVTYQQSEYNTIQFLIWSWLLGVLVSAVLSIWRVWKLFDWSGWDKFEGMDWKRVKKGARYSLPFFVSTIALQIIEISDRFVIGYYLDIASVGVYVFSQNIGSLLQTASVIGLISVAVPKLTTLYMQGKKEAYARLYKLLIVLLTIAVTASVAVLVLAFPVFAEFSGKADIAESKTLFYMVLTGYVLSVYSVLPYYSLYFRHKDWTLAQITVAGAVINLILNIILIPVYGEMGAAYSTIVAFLFIFIARISALYGDKPVLTGEGR